MLSSNALIYYLYVALILNKLLYEPHFNIILKHCLPGL